MFCYRTFALWVFAAFLLNTDSLHAEEKPAKSGLKAVAEVKPHVAKVAVRGANNAGCIIVLDAEGSASSTNGDLSYKWKQSGGVDLSLPEAALTKSRVGLYIYKTGKYKFQLTVSEGGSSSEPAEVEVEVVVLGATGGDARQ